MQIPDPAQTGQCFVCGSQAFAALYWAYHSRLIVAYLHGCMFAYVHVAQYAEPIGGLTLVA